MISRPYEKLLDIGILFLWPPGARPLRRQHRGEFLLTRPGVPSPLFFLNMKLNSTLVLLRGGAVAAALSGLLYGQETLWESIGDPGGNGGVTFTSIHPATGNLFTGSDMSRSVFRSRNHADDWEPIANPVTGTPDYIAGDPSAPGTLYMSQIGVTAKGTGLWKSTDNGDTWNLLCQTGKFGKSNGHSGLVDPGDPRILYWTGVDKGVMRSVDGGVTWADWSSGLPKDKLKYTYAFAHTLELDQNSPLAQRRIFYPTNLGLYEATAPAGSWHLSRGLPDGVCSDVEVCNGNIIYAAFPKAGLYMSRDGGGTWVRKMQGLGDKKIVRVVATNEHPEIVYVSTDGDIGESGNQAIYGSRDTAESFALLTDARFHEGMNWPLNYRQEEGVSARELFVDPHDPMTVYVVRGMKSTDGGKTWHNYGMKEVRQDRWQGAGLPLLTEYRVVFDPRPSERHLARVFRHGVDAVRRRRQDDHQCAHLPPWRGQSSRVLARQTGAVLRVLRFHGRGSRADDDDLCFDQRQDDGKSRGRRRHCDQERGQRVELDADL